MAVWRDAWAAMGSKVGNGSQACFARVILLGHVFWKKGAQRGGVKSGLMMVKSLHRAFFLTGEG